MKICVLPPTAGRRTQLFLLIFTEPGNRTLAHPCTCIDEGSFIQPLKKLTIDDKKNLSPGLMASEYATIRAATLGLPKPGVTLNVTRCGDYGCQKARRLSVRRPSVRQWQAWRDTTPTRPSSPSFPLPLGRDGTKWCVCSAARGGKAGG